MLVEITVGDYSWKWCSLHGVGKGKVRLGSRIACGSLARMSAEAETQFSRESRYRLH